MRCAFRHLEERLANELAALANHPSASHRWIRSMLVLSTSNTDLKTLCLWAKAAGLSCSSLRELSYLVHGSPRDAKDLGRVLRAVIKSPMKWQPELFLDISDRRTLDRLRRRAGLDNAKLCGETSLVDLLFTTQSFVDRSNSAVQELQSITCHAERRDA